MNIEFIKIEIQNFKSIGEMITLNYSDLKGLNFVYGKNIDVPNAKNGSGKSSILIDAISFALYGKTLKNTNNKYVPNRLFLNKLKSFVKIYFKIDEQLYSNETYGKFVGKEMHTIGMELLKLDDNYEIIEDLTQSSIIKTKQYIQDNLIGCSFDIFKSSIIMSSSEFMNFYEGLGKEGKRKYIENIFNLNCFGEMFKLVKTNLNDVKKESTFLKNEIFNISSSITNLEKKFNEYNNQSIETQENIKNKIIEKYNKIKLVSKECEKLKNNNYNDIKDQLKIKKQEIDKILMEKNKLEKEKLTNELEIKHINKLIKDLNNIKEGLCEKCKNLMNERYDLSKNINEIKQAEQNIDNISKLIETKSNNYGNLKNDYDKLKNDLSKEEILNNKYEKVSMELSYLKNEIKNLKNEYDNHKENDKNPFEDLLNNAKDTLKKSKMKLILFNKNLKHLEILKEACSENGVKKFIIKDIIKLLNSLIQKYLNEIGSEMLVYFDETMDFTFLTQSGECEFSSFSAGEKQRIQISTMFAFRDLILSGKVHSNIFIIDEMLDSNIDTICIENVMKILKRKSIESNQNIFIVSHRSELADNEGYWNNIIKVTKENGISTYKII